MVSTAVMNYLMETAVISMVLPVVFLCIWRLRTRKNMMPALAGLLAFLAFAELLQVIPYTFFVGYPNPVSNIVSSSEVLYALYLGLSAAILEETGRYLAFRYFLAKYANHRETAITYGIGHGGISLALSLGWGNLQYYITATVLDGVPEAAEEVPEAIVAQIQSLDLFDCVLDGLSALLLFILQIGLSVLVFQAYRNPALCKRLLSYAALSHLLYYLPNGFYRSGLIPHILSLVLTLLLILPPLIMAFDIYRKMGENEKKEEERRKAEAAAKGGGFAVAKKKLSNLEEPK